MAEERNWDKRVKRVASGARGRVTDARERLADSMQRGAQATSAAVGGAAATVPDLLGSISPPILPLAGPWSIGLGQVLAAHPDLPTALCGAVGQLDRFGSVRIDAHGLGFDGETVRWDRI